MRISIFHSRSFLMPFFMLLQIALFAQQNNSVTLEGAKMRAPLVVPKGNSTVQLCGLTAGNLYTIVATPKALGQQAEFEIALPSKAKAQFLQGKKNALRFTATTACMELQLKSATKEQGTAMPMYLSVVCENCAGSHAWRDRIMGQADQSVMQVQGGQTAEQLVKNVLVGGNCFQVSNVTFQGQSEQIGTFSNGNTSIGFNSGIIMATGNIDVAPGPNDAQGASNGFGNSTPDADLAELATGNLFDRAAIQFDFVPTQSQVAFEFVFASEEYCEYVDDVFNDVFGFFISGPNISGTQNIALIPGSIPPVPITINNVSHLTNSNYYIHNIPSIQLDCPFVQPATGPATLEIQYDGFTKKIVAVANVTPCQTYHIKLKIADVFDGVWDSAVFLRANSFDAGGAAIVTATYPSSLGSSLTSAYEGCTDGFIRFKRGNTDLSQPLVINFNVGGTASPGGDYAPLPNAVTIPVGATEVLLPINVVNDMLPEGQETILLTLDNACSCTQSVITFLINDRLPLAVGLESPTLCIGQTATLASDVTGGLPNFTYAWSTGESTASISPGTTGTYTIVVADACGGTASASSLLSFVNCAPDNCDAETFIKTLGQAGENVRGYGIYHSADGNLYITGQKQDSALIVKMTPAGAVLWTRAIDVRPGENDQIAELITDSEGMLVGAGQTNEVQPGIKGFVFRYNPATNNLQWVNTFEQESSFVMGLVELPNGNYLINDNPHNPSNDARMLEVTRADGTIDYGSPLTQKLNLVASADNFSSLLLHSGKLYGVGRFTNGVNFADMRNTLACIDLGGTVDWAHFSHVDPSLPARLYGMDLLIEDEEIISVAYGSETGDQLDDNRIFLQKNDLDGNLLWIKRFDVVETGTETADEVISVPDGFVIYAHGLDATNDLYLIKTDKNGLLQWSKKVDYGFNDFIAPVSVFQSQILLKDNHLFFMASTQEQGSDSQMLVMKTTLDGTVEGHCDFIIPTVVEASEVVNPFDVPVVLTKVPFSEETVTIVRMPQATSMSLQNQCKVYIEEQFEISLCPGETVLIDSIVYAQDTTFSIEIAGTNGCDTLRTYTIETLPYQTRTENIAFCPGSSFTIDGQVYTQSGIVMDTLAGTVGCDTIVTYNLTLLPYQTRSENIEFCPGTSVTIDGQVYTQSATVIDTVMANSGCDTIVTYNLTLLPQPTRAETISFCPGKSVTLGGQVYTQPGVVVITNSGANGACDTIITYTLVLLPQPTRAESISFCPGKSVTLGGQTYTQPGVVTITASGANGACDTIVTYTLTLLPQPTRAETISFCPGSAVMLGGQAYTQPGVVTRTLAGANGACDTIVTYTLQFSTPAPSNVNIVCPGNISIGLPSGAGGAVATYALPTASSDCVCPGVALTLTSGLPSGSNFPAGTTSVCYTAKDSCGQSASCCFNVTIEEDDPCDTKVNGCVKYELLTITEDMGKNRTYRIRVTNNCSNKLLYTAIQVPDGVVAINPANFSTYMAPSGNTYKVRNPNYSPQYSVRYSSMSDSIRNGESDIFKYTLPAQTDVLFINVVSRLEPYVYISAHLNTFYCPIGITPANSDRPEAGSEERNDFVQIQESLFVFPNPTSGDLFADFSPWLGQSLDVRVFDSRGQRVHQSNVIALDDAQAMDLPRDLPNGLYFLEILPEKGGKQSARFVVQR